MIPGKGWRIDPMPADAFRCKAVQRVAMISEACLPKIDGVSKTTYLVAQHHLNQGREVRMVLCHSCWTLHVYAPLSTAQVICSDFSLACLCVHARARMCARVCLHVCTVARNTPTPVTSPLPPSSSPTAWTFVSTGAAHTQSWPLRRR